MLELFLGFGLNPWSMCDVVFPALNESFPSCVGVFNTLLCHSSMSYREQGAGEYVYCHLICGHRACLWQIQIGKLGGSPWLEECLCGLGLSYSAMFLHGVMLCQNHTALHDGVWDVAIQPIHVPLPASGIFKLTHSRESLNSVSEYTVKTLSKPELGAAAKWQTVWYSTCATQQGHMHMTYAQFPFGINNQIETSK